MQKLFFCWLLLFLISVETFANKAPSSIEQNIKSANLIGKTELNYLGFKVYDIELWCEKSHFSYQEKFAIRIRYNMNFSKEDLAERSVEEIALTHSLSDSERKNYYQKLLQIFTDVKKGDEKVAVFIPQNGIEMFHNNHLIGKISDLRFARFFVDIWLDNNGSFPRVTKKLLGQFLSPKNRDRELLKK